MVVCTSPSLPLRPFRRRTRLRRRAVSAGLGAGMAIAVLVAAPSAHAASKGAATKSTSRVAAKGASESTVKATTTTLPKPISAGNSLKGWESIGATEWPSNGDAVIASATGRSVEVFRIPDDRRDVLRLDSGRSVFGSVRLLALGARGDYIRVAVPIRPNETVGWVKRSEVNLSRTALRIVIELSTNIMTVTDGDTTIMKVPVAAGTGGTPTPTGLFFLKELVPQANPNGALGPYAFGLSGFSTVLMSFAGGQGVIGIHGTNSPGKLGGDVSHGCVRVDNTTIRKLAGLLDLGTPVEIVNRLEQLPPKAFRMRSDWLEGAAASSAAASASTVEVTTTTTAAAVGSALPSTSIATTTLLPAATLVPTSVSEFAITTTTSIPGAGIRL